MTKQTPKLLIGFQFILFLASSCIPNDKVLYLQDKTQTIPDDSLISLSRVHYRLQPNDILLINFYSGVAEAVEKYYPIFARPNAIQAGGKSVGDIV